ncbi:MAG: Rap1a/Tai family immunity protein [Rhodovibrionaceae bacterium]
MALLAGIIGESNRQRRTLAFCAFCQVFLTLSAATSAEDKGIEKIGLSTADLYRICAGQTPACTAYISGVIDTAILNHHLFSQERDRGFVGPGQITFCFPEGFLERDPVPLFMEFAEENPGRGDFAAAESVMLAMNAGFPCPEAAE